MIFQIRPKLRAAWEIDQVSNQVPDTISVTHSLFKRTVVDFHDVGQYGGKGYAAQLEKQWI